MNTVINKVTQFSFEKTIASYIVIITLIYNTIGPYIGLNIKCDIDISSDSKIRWVLPESFVYGDRLT